MKKLFFLIQLILSIILASNTLGQGIYFDEKSSIDSLLKKASLEGKLVFLDAYTTSCIPCKEMAQEIFPKDEVGMLMNKNFVSISLQIDKDKNDNEDVKRRYPMAQFLKSKYNIEVFPTYLFIKPNGKLVYKFVGKTNDAKEFLAHAARAITAEVDLDKMRENFKNGERDSLLFANLLNNAFMLADDVEKEAYIHEYIKRGYSFNPNNIHTLLDVLKTSQSPIFIYAYQHKNEIIKLGYGEQLFNKLYQIAFEELVFPYLKINGVIKKYAGGLTIYDGTNNEKVNWEDIKKRIQTMFPAYTEFFLSKAKITYAIWTENEQLLLSCINQLTFPDFFKNSYRKYSLFANDVFNFCTKNELLKPYILSLKKELSSDKHYNERDYLILVDLYLKINDKAQARWCFNEFINSKKLKISDITQGYSQKLK